MEEIMSNCYLKAGDLYVNYDCLIIGGGIAGLQAAIQLGRYKRSVLVIDASWGRSTICRSYHNILGWPDGVAGHKLRELAKQHVAPYNVNFHYGKVMEAEKNDLGFTVTDETGNQFSGKCILLATGVMDRLPDLPGLLPCLGLTVYVCPDCDGYEISNKKTIVMGAGKTGATMALTLTYWTDDITYINHEQSDPGADLAKRLADKNIAYVNEPIKRILTENEWEFRGVELAGGKRLDADRGFVAFGGNKVNSDLAQQLGVERLENKHILVDPRTKMTNVANVWAAGDVVAHSELVTVAMGEGSQAAIWIQKKLLEMDRTDK